MTGHEMNGHVTKKIRLRWAHVLMPLGVIALCGCASSFDARTLSSGPLTQAQDLVDASRTYPRWEDFPQATSDVPSSQAIAQRLVTLQVTDSQLQQEVAQIQWGLDDPAEFEREIRSRLSSIRLSTEAPLSEAEIEALAERLRQRAKAPPPIGRTP